MLGGLTPALPIRLYNIPGYDGRSNDVVYCHPVVQTEQQTTVVYFGGDVQDFTENMRNHRDNKNYLKWNLEDTARVLQSGFMHCHVVVIRPSRMEYKTFSCFENFVPCVNCGAPEHTPNHFALLHLEKLLQNISDKVKGMSEAEMSTAAAVSKAALIQTEPEQVSSAKNSGATEETQKESESESIAFKDTWWKDKIALDQNHLKVVGFSKGCVVLNQFLYEFHYLKTLTPDDSTMTHFVSKIKDMYWLDGGHSGGKNTWITSRPLLETFTRLGINVHIHVTPYQIHDERRPWIRKEEKAFSDLLQQLGAPVFRVVHFPNAMPNLFLHFDVLTMFKEVESRVT